jgi:hypothetical protein
MWAEGFLELSETQQSIEGLLVSGRVDFRHGDQKLVFNPSALASSAMAYRSACSAKPDKPFRLTLLGGTEPADARLLVASLLFADLFARERGGRRPLLEGDVLLVTKRMRDAIDFLRRVTVGRSAKLAGVWNIESVAMHHPPPAPGGHLRVWIATPLHFSFLRDPRHTFSAVVVDGCEDEIRIAAESLLSSGAAAAAPLQLLTLPAGVPRPRLSGQEELAWLWDPAAENLLGQLLGTGVVGDVPERSYWVCDDTAADQLERAHAALVALTRVASRAPEGDRLWTAWAIYHSLRGTSVPLAVLEDLRLSRPAAATIKGQLDGLCTPPDIGFHARPVVDVHWPAMVEALRNTYARLRELAEPPKFWALAQAVEALACSHPGRATEIIVPGEDDRALLVRLLASVIDGLSGRIERGLLRVATAGRRSPSVAAGESILLTGMRSASRQHLDLYAKTRLDVVVYPFEALMDQRRLENMYRDAARLCEGSRRDAVLASLGITTGPAKPRGSVTVEPMIQTTAPVISVTQCTPLRLRQHTELEFEPFAQEWVARSGRAHVDCYDDVVARTAREGAGVEVTLEGGETLFLPAEKHAYVFHPAASDVRSVPASALLPDELLIVVEDDRYADLFDRMVSEQERSRPADRAFKLSFWQLVKRSALSRFGGSRRRLHEHLRDEGLRVDYGALATWFREGEREIIGPEARADFLLLAEASGLVRDQEVGVSLFEAVQDERVNRRRLGRALRLSLISMFHGDYDRNVMAQSEALTVLAEDIVHMVTLQRIESVVPIAA